MITFTKEQLIARINQVTAINKYRISRDPDADGLAMDNELARIALASLEAEPAIHRWRRVTSEPYGPYPWHYGDFIGFSKPVDGIEDEYFYSAPPAPANAEPVAWLWSHRKHPSEVSLVRPEDDERAEGAHWSGWSCQALYAAPPAPVSLQAGGKLSNFVASQESLGGDFEKVLAENIEELYVPGSSVQPAPVSVPDDVSGPLAHAYKELTPTFMRNHIDVFERYGIYPDGSAGIQAMRIALDGMNRRAAMLQGGDGSSPVIPDSARDALEKALAAMEFMGDTLNNLDAVCTEDVELVAPAFYAVRSVLAAAPQQEVKP